MDTFELQVDTASLVSDLVYTLGAFAVILIVLALALIDAGSVRQKNVLDTWIVKVTASVIAALGTIVLGYSFWQWSFYQAFDVPDALWQAVKDWWIGGTYQSAIAVSIDPKVLPGADVQQIFVVFFATFSMATVALIHSGLLERVRPRALFAMAAVIGLCLSPLASYLTWGPVGPLTTLGLHDFEGVFPLYIFSGTWVLVMCWRLGPRLGAFTAHPSGTAPRKQNQSLIGAGVLLIMFALPFVAIGATWILPGEGIFGISFARTGWGTIVINIAIAFFGGGVSGAVLSYWKRNAAFAFVGPLAGVVICGTLLDVGTSVEVLILSLFGPPVAYLAGVLFARLGIDDAKVVPLGLGTGVVGAIATGFIAWGTPSGGYPDATGNYALYAGSITPWWQAIGVVVIMLLAGIPSLLLCLIFERFGGLRVSQSAELAGLDQANWNVDNVEFEPTLTLSALDAGDGRMAHLPDLDQP